MATKTVKHVRDTKSGQYVKPEEAKKRPVTTVETKSKRSSFT